MMKKYLIFCGLLLLGISVSAHTINYTLEETSGNRVFIDYVLLGFKHILPLGLDHILFILCIFFLNKNLKSVLIQASMFTLAHSITLGLTAAGIINPPGSIIETLIALSIALLAIENIYREKVTGARLITIFMFGLVHGMGFAGALAETGIPSDAFLEAIVGFNIGVEIGQATIILLAFITISYNFSKKIWYRKRIIIPVSFSVLLISLWWTVERFLSIQF